MSGQLIIPKEFWEELEEVYRGEIAKVTSMPKEKKGEVSVPTEFWKELQTVYEEESKSGVFDYDPSKEPDDEILNQLESALENIRKKAAQEVAEERTRNSASPLFLPFSLFEPMNREHSEVHYTKTLAWFMNEENGHGFGNGVLTVLLPLFLDREKAIPADGCDVKAEEWGDEKEGKKGKKNRFDITIKRQTKDGNDFAVLIEAKVNAEEGEEQLARYERECKSCEILVFLTPDGRKPKTAKKENRWIPLRWREIAAKLLEYLDTDKAKTAKAYHLLRFFVTSIIRDIDKIDAEENPVATAIYINALKEEHHD